MSSLDRATYEFITAVLSSEEYRAYRTELDKVKQFPELKAQIDDYRKKNYELQTSVDINFNKLDAFEKEYETFRENLYVQDFLAAELDFCRLMQGLYDRITAALNFE